MKINKSDVRRWVRKFYKCHWTFSENTISIKCDDEEFYIDTSRLDEIDLEILKNIINDEQFKEEITNI